MEFEAGDFKLGCSRPVPHVERTDCVGITKPKAFHRTMCDVEQWRQITVVSVCQKQSVARNQPNEMFKGGLDRIEIFENIRMVEFKVIDDGDFGQVMNELAALIKESCVIFVALNNKPFAIRKSCALAEIVGNPANEITWIQSVML